MIFTGNPFTDLLTVIAIMAAVVLVFLIILKIVLFFNKFYYKLKRINQEIRRTDGTERRHWKREKKRLWLSLIPFYHR